jgi:membrane-associated phospholipid phosphatase
MSDHEITQLAELLAAHAVVLLGLGLAIGLAVVGAVYLGVRALVRLEHPFRAAFVSAARRAWHATASAARARQVAILIPSGFLAVHLILGLALAGLVAAFVVLAQEVAGGGELTAFDVAFARALLESTSPGWHRAFVTVSWLGSAPVLALVSGVVAVQLFRERRGMLAVAWIVAQAGGGLLNLALKALFARTRPDVADPLLASGWSFPSGHAMGTFIFCGMFAYLLLRRTWSWSGAILIVSLALAWCVVMSFSRLYLGVHFATDVTAGLIAGGAWITVCIAGVELVLRRETRLRGSAAPVNG